MNTPVRRLSQVVLLIFVVLLLGVSYVQVVKAPSLNADPRNVRTLYHEYGSFRGPLVVDGKEIAKSTPSDDVFGYQRSYPDPNLYAAVTGYYSVVVGRSGMERYANELLNGTSDTLWWQRLQELVSGKDPQGYAVELTIDPAAQQAAWDALGDQRGAVVALDTHTGAVLAMVSKPSYDPNTLAAHRSSKVNDAYQHLLHAKGDPLVNRAVGGATYPPGSVFKLVTASAALESGDFTPKSKLNGTNGYTLPGTQTVLHNFGGITCSPTGKITLADALRISCNTAFASLGAKLGADALRDQADAYGFDRPLTIPLAVTESRFPDDIDDAQTALSAIGQGSVRVTPLQVAMISATIANGGTELKPHLIKDVLAPDLSVVTSTSPSTLGKPISPATADTLTDMMKTVVTSGTGTAAQIPGVKVAGKSGTAETVQGAAPHAWFTAFAPADDPQVAVAAVVEHGGDAGSEATGGAVAAPIAKAVLQAVVQP